MEQKKEKLVINGNAFYELDLDCIRKRNIIFSDLSDKNNTSEKFQKTQKRQRK